EFAIDPFLNLVRKLIRRGRCGRNRGRNGNSGSSRCRERGRRSRRFWRGGRCLCVDGQHQPKSGGAAKNKCFHSFHLLMRCRLKGKWIQKSFTLLGQRWRFAKTRPEPDLRYFSNAMAVFSVTNAKYATISHGANFAVCGRSPILVIYQSLLEIARQTDVSLVRGGFRLQNVDVIH